MSLRTSASPLLLLPVFLALGSGCAATHPRHSPELKEILSSPRRIVVLTPSVKVKVQSIYTDEFVPLRQDADELSRRFEVVLLEALIKRGHEALTSRNCARYFEAPQASLETLVARLDDVGTDVIAYDPDYSTGTVPENLSAAAVLPPGLSAEADLVLMISADVTKETTKELWWRWTKNIGLNLATLPIAVASIFIPVTLPISVTISTSIFEPSPDRIYAELVVLDTRTGKVVYQNDYYYTTVPEDEDLAEVAEYLLEGFCAQRD